MKLARSPERTLIFGLDIHEVSNGAKRLQHRANASELLTNEDIYNKIDLNVGADWLLVASDVKHFISISAPYQIMVRIGGVEMTIDKLFAMQGKIEHPIYIKSNYFESDNTYINVRCTILVS